MGKSDQTDRHIDSKVFSIYIMAKDIIFYAR